MRYATINFQGVKAHAEYACNCSDCGKLLKRKVTVEHTINPFNTDEDGAVKTRAQVYASAQAEAKASAEVLQRGANTCRDCEEKPNRDLLLAMAAAPDRIFPEPPNYWASPMHFLADRKQVESVYEKCLCGSACCSGYINRNGYRITALGKKRAATLLAQAQKIAA